MPIQEYLKGLHEIEAGLDFKELDRSLRQSQLDFNQGLSVFRDRFKNLDKEVSNLKNILDIDIGSSLLGQQQARFDRASSFIGSNLTRDFNVGRESLNLLNARNLAEIDLSLLDAQADHSLSQLNIDLQSLDVSNRNIKERIGIQRDIYGILGDQQDLLNQRRPLIDDLKRIGIGASQIAQDNFLSAVRGTQYEISTQKTLASIQGQVSGFYAGASPLTSSQQLINISVDSGVKLGELLSRVDQENLNQQKIITDTVLRKNNIDLSVSRIEVSKLNVKSRISQLKASLRQNEYARKRIELRKRFISDTTPLRKERVKANLQSREDIFELYRDYQSRLKSLNDVAYVIGEGFAFKQGQMQILRLQEQFKTRLIQFERRKDAQRYAFLQFTSRAQKQINNIKNARGRALEFESKVKDQRRKVEDLETQANKGEVRVV